MRQTGGWDFRCSGRTTAARAETANHPAHNVDQHSDNGQTDEHRQRVVANCVKTDAPKKESCLLYEGRFVPRRVIPRLIALAIPRLINAEEEQPEYAREDRYAELGALYSANKPCLALKAPF